MRVWTSRLVFLTAALLIAACPLPDPQPQDETIPGFTPCRATHMGDAQYSICPSDAGFPYDQWVAGVIVGTSASSGLPATLSFQTEDGAVWSLSATMNYGFAIRRAEWSAELEADAPPVELRVATPCDESGHWFAIRSATSGELIAAGGIAGNASVDDWTIDGSLQPDRCLEPVDVCPCSEQCTVSPIRYSRGSLSVELHPSERAMIEQDFEVFSFESWSAVGESTCADGRTEGRRWLVLGYGE